MLTKELREQVLAKMTGARSRMHAEALMDAMNEVLDPIYEKLAEFEDRLAALEPAEAPVETPKAKK